MKNLDKLIFFTEKGYEIPVQKTYTLEWEIIPNDQVKNNFIENPKGHIIIDSKDLSGENARVIIDNPGKVLLSTIDIYGQFISTTEPVLTISTIKDIILLNTSYDYTVNKYPSKYNITETKTDYIRNQVKLTINLLDSISEQLLPIEIFDNLFTKKISNSNGLDYYIIDALSLAKDDDVNQNIIEYLVSTIFNGSTELLQPGVRYSGVIKQDKVSTDFIATSTIVLLAELENNIYKHPLYNDTSSSLMFTFQNNSEMKFISSNTVADIIWEDEYNITYNKKEDEDNPGYFTVGFQTGTEGCYQNIMAMYVVENSQKYLCGLFTILTEVEGEDERYRALLGNLGIPDPANYSNIFKSQDHLEELVDWTLVNTKSKELMINYDNIFPYAGTYKALLNAVKFLGYYDLIFKEWYKIKDQNNKDRFVTLQTYDTITGKSLKSKLKSINVNFGEFERYKKLNRLTMVYHIDQLDEDNTEETLSVIDSSGNSKPIVFDIPQIKKIYEYRTDEILAKLYSVKVWLENHILGANCYIADICGEGIVVDRVKTQAYVTEHYLNDFYSEAYITPKITNISEFKQSKSVITCSLNEYNSVTFETYKNTPIENFIKSQTVTSIIKDDNNGLTNITIYNSNPLGCLILADEIQYELHTENCSSGSLYEFMKPHIKNEIVCECNPIIVQDNNIIMYDNNKHTSYIDDTECPIIELAVANIRTVYGNWKSNIKYTISSKINSSTGNEHYIINSINNGIQSNVYNSIRKPFFYPSLNIGDTKLIYTSENQWNVPMFIMKGYKCDFFDNIDQEQEYILEIIKGRLIFKNKMSDISNGESGYAIGAEVLFGYEDLSFDDIRQSIEVNYTYSSERIPVYTYNAPVNTTGMTKHELLSYLENIAVQYDTSCNINVNRACDYTVTVKGFDAYNHIYTNKSDKHYSVRINHVNIEMYLNSEAVKNNKSFHDSIQIGQLLDSSNKVSILLNKVQDNTIPLHPKSYRIYDIDVMPDQNNIIEYDNISYSIDIPEEKDYIVFNNFTERISHIIDGSIYLYDGNPNPNTIKHAHTIGICLYDNIKKEIIDDIDNIKVLLDSSLNPQIYINNNFDKNTVYNNANSYIKIDNSNIDTTLLNSKLSETVYGYVYNTTSVKVNTDNIIVDYTNNETSIILDNLYYTIGDVIKLCYNHDYDENGKVCNEAAYRIKNIYVNDNEYIYILDGIFDTYKLNNKVYKNITEHYIIDTSVNKLEYDKFTVYISPAHLNAAQYILRAESNGEELTSIYNDAIVQRTQVKYEAGPLLFDSYLDTNYSAVIYKYNPNILDNMWIDDIFTYYKNTDNIYMYNNVPITIDKGRIIIIKYNENQDILYNEDMPFNIQWNWYSHLVETVSNPSIKRDYQDKRLIFSAKNNILPIIPDILGPQTIELVITDIYGNRSINSGSGLLYIQTPSKTYVKRKKLTEYNIPKYDNRILDINISETSDVQLYGATKPVNSIIAADGETVTVYLNDGHSYKSSKTSGMMYPINIPTYTIYYSNGMVIKNKGAKFTLLDEDGNTLKDNKVKLKIPKAKQGHKHIVKTFKLKLQSQYNMEKDIVQDKIIDIPIMQYGNIKTTQIYNLQFSLHNVESCGVDDLNNEYWDSMIYNVSYDMKRSDNSIEHITGNNLDGVNLIITNYKFISSKYGYTNSIDENKMKKHTYIGILKITVQFMVNGVTDIIETSYTTQVYQD